MNLHRTQKKPDWEYVAERDRTLLQRIAYKTHGVVTPANLITLVGVFTVILGLILFSIDRSCLGIVLIVFGRIMDIIDGMIADWTKTKSPLGEFMDASADKILLLVVLGFAYLLNTMPLWVIALILMLTFLVVSVSFTARLKNVELHPSRTGKYATAILWLAIIAFIVSDGMKDLYLLAIVTAVVGLGMSSVSLYQYSKQLRLR